MATKLKFTVNITGVFEETSYAAAQAWVINQLMQNEEFTHMDLQRVDLVRWSDPTTNKPIDATTGKPINEDDE